MKSKPKFSAATYERIGVSAKVLLVSLLALLPAAAAQQPNIQYAQNFAGADVGAQINAAYTALPSSGGQIVVSKGATFHTHIAFTTPNKPVLLAGLPGDMVSLTYTGAGTAITFDYGMNHRMGHGLRDLTLTGPEYYTNTVGIEFGGKHGAEGTSSGSSKSRALALTSRWDRIPGWLSLNTA